MDTALISDIYCQRPGNIAHIPFGQWFCTAMNVSDNELFYARLHDAKQIIIKKGYTDLPDLEKELKEYNQLFVEK